MYCGFDIGGSKLLGLAVDPADHSAPVALRREPTACDAGMLIETIESTITALESDAGRSIQAVGVGIAGIVDRSGRLRYSPNIAGVVDLDLRQRLRRDLRRPVIVENDATAAAWAEVQLGAGRGCDDVVFVALGTGVGTGFVLDGRLHHGAHGFAGESGHMIVAQGGPEHLTGARGPWEYFASGPGLARLAQEFAAAGRLPSVAGQAATIAGITGEHVHAAVAAGHRDAMELLEEFCGFVAIGIANLVHILDPEIVIIGGGLIEIGEALLSGISRWTDAYQLGGDRWPNVEVVAAELGSRSGALGAALLAARSPE